MAYLQRAFHVDLSVSDSVTVRGVRYVLVASNEAGHILREETSDRKIEVQHREFAELLADGEATVVLDAYVLWTDVCATRRPPPASR